jgi:hypothetical protein
VSRVRFSISIQIFRSVTAGLDPGIHSAAASTCGDETEWMPGSSPGMKTAVEQVTVSIRSAA